MDEYGPEFRYGHYVQVKKLSGVAALIGGVGALFAGAQLKPIRNLILKMKAQGDGPSPETRAKSWFRVRFIGEAASGEKVTVDVKGGDPGYGETSKMLAESGMCLAFDKLPKSAGQVTPATAMGNALITRLQNAGITFEVVSA